MRRKKNKRERVKDRQTFTHILTQSLSKIKYYIEIKYETYLNLTTTKKTEDEKFQQIIII